MKREITLIGLLVVLCGVLLHAGFRLKAILDQLKVPVKIELEKPAEPQLGLSSLGKYPCRAGAVFWKDAMTYTRAGGVNLSQNWQNFLGNAMTIGCVSEKDNVIFILHEVAGDSINDFSVIPKEWSVRIVYFGEVKNGKKN